MKALLDAASLSASLIPDALIDGHDLAGKTVLDVADDFTWYGKSVDWTALTIVNDLTAIKAAAVTLVCNQAESVRDQFLTPGSGQALTYQRKEAEARSWTAGAPDTQFPFLAAEAAATGTTVADLAIIVIAQADAWIYVGSTIEALRRGALVAIDAATTIGEIEAAATVNWGVIGA